MTTTRTDQLAAIDRTRAERWGLRSADADDTFWRCFTLGVLLVCALLPLVWEPRFYFHGDTQIAYTGWWYELGMQVRAGHLPLMDPLRWEAGNYIAEGQWGLFSPLTIAIGLAATAVSDLVVFATALKILLILVGGLGTYLLVRSYDVAPSAASVAGILVGFSSASIFLDWPSWVNGQMAVALLPWAWWSVRRASRVGASPLPALILCYLVTTIGYVYALLYVGLVIGACFLAAALHRNARAAGKVLGIGVFTGLVGIAVYLPGVLTAPVTVRAGWEIVGSGRMTVDVGELLTSMLPVPALHLVWCLPLVLWVDPHRVRSAVHGLADALIATVLLLAWVLGPASLGPLRWPARVIPALMVALVVSLVIIVARSLRTSVGRLPILASIGWVLAAGYLVVVREWSREDDVMLGVLVILAGLVVAAWANHRSHRMLALVIGLWTIVVAVTQHVASPEPPSKDRHMPAAAAEYRTLIPEAAGDTAVVGAPDNYSKSAIVRNPAIADELVLGSLWNLNTAQVQNGYTTISFKEFRDRFCRRYNGDTCDAGLKRLLAREPTTGRRWVDLLTISTLVLYRPDFKNTDLADPPKGWHVAGDSTYTVTWVRDELLPTAGGVVWSTDGVVVDELRSDARTLVLAVREAPEEGGSVVLSRLPWPGYEVEGARFGDPLESVLLRVQLTPKQVGSTVTVQWSPPGWTAELLSWWLAVLGGLGWTVVAYRRGRHRPRARDADEVTGGPTPPSGSARYTEDDGSVEQPPRRGSEHESDHVGRDVVREH